MKAIKISPGGIVAAIDRPDDGTSLGRLHVMQEEVRGDIEFIPMDKVLGDGYQMVVDEAYLFKKPHIVNAVASVLYRHQIGNPIYGPASLGVIYGHALIVKDCETEDGTDTVGLDDEEIDRLMGVIDSWLQRKAA